MTSYPARIVGISMVCGGVPRHERSGSPRRSHEARLLPRKRAVKSGRSIGVSSNAETALGDSEVSTQVRSTGPESPSAAAALSASAEATKTPPVTAASSGARLDDKIKRRRLLLGSQLPKRDVVDVDRHDDVAGIDAVGGVAWMDAVPGGQCDAIYGNEAVEQVGGRGSGDDLDLVVVPRQAAGLVEVERLLRAVAGQVLRPFDAQPPESLSVLALGWDLLSVEAVA